MRSGRNKKQIDPNLKPEELERQAYARAIRLLGAREHTTTELRNKLGDSGFSSDVIELTLEQLIRSGYQSDERFATLYAEQLLRKHYGPLAISAKLSARGIDSAQSREAIELLDADWCEVATDALRSRFSSRFLSFTETPVTDAATVDAASNSEYDAAGKPELDQAEVGKYARFLNRRGFSSTDSIKAIRLAAETVSD